MERPGGPSAPHLPPRQTGTSATLLSLVTAATLLISSRRVSLPLLFLLLLTTKCLQVYRSTIVLESRPPSSNHSFFSRSTKTLVSMIRAVRLVSSCLEEREATSIWFRHVCYGRNARLPILLSKQLVHKKCTEVLTWKQTQCLPQTAWQNH